MNGLWEGWRNGSLGLIALAVCAALPAATHAEDLYFRNDTTVTVVVQGSFLNAAGRVVNDRPKLVLPGRAVQVSLPGNKVITVRESRAPNRILAQERLAAAAEDKFILINPDPPLKVKLDLTTKKEFLTPKKP
jgi:hypothetical protein